MLAAAQNALRDRLHAFTDIKITLREGLTALAPQALRAHREPPGFLSTKACESRPSPKELEELELLNRALEKALKVRKSISKTSLEAQVAPAEKPADEGPAFENAQEQQVPVSVRDVPVTREGMGEKPSLPNKCRCSSCKEAFYREDPDYCILPQLATPFQEHVVQCSKQRVQSVRELLLFEFCSPTPALSPAEIEEELKVLQDVPSLLSRYVEAEPAAVESQMRLHPDCAGDVGNCCPTCVPARGRACGSAGTLAVPVLWYSSFQELRDLFALKLQVSMLHQEIALQKLTMTELLPVLESKAYPEASAAQLYRAIYTQLCEGGERFPVLVRDELAD
nr:tubulin epsilon and delta complex protein 2 [Anser cygnoides]